MVRNSPSYIRQLSKELRNNQTVTEQMLWNAIRRKQLGGFRFLRQYVIDRYIADFYCSKVKIAVELDGNIHELKEQQEYDCIRDKIIRMHKIKVVRFTNDEIINNISEVLNKLLDLLLNS